MCLFVDVWLVFKRHQVRPRCDKSIELIEVGKNYNKTSNCCVSLQLKRRHYVWEYSHTMHRDATCIEMLQQQEQHFCFFFFFALHSPHLTGR